MISYTQYNDETKDDFARLVALTATSFFKWRTRSARRLTFTMPRALQVWWMTSGPTGFKTTADSSRFRAELLAEVLATTQAEA